MSSIKPISQSFVEKNIASNAQRDQDLIISIEKHIAEKNYEAALDEITFRLPRIEINESEIFIKFFVTIQR